MSNDDAGFKKIGSWVANVGKDFDTVLFCMEYTVLYNQNFRLWLESKEYIYGMVEPHKMHRLDPDLHDDQRSLDRIKNDELDVTLEYHYFLIQSFAKPNVFLFPFNAKMSIIWIRNFTLA